MAKNQTNQYTTDVKLNFRERVESLVGFSIEDSESPVVSAELDQFLKDGIIDVIQKIVKLDPLQKMLFAKKHTVNHNESIGINSGEVLEVLRADGTSSTNLYKATRIPNSQQYTATDKESLNYRSKLNPGYYFDNKYLKILPAPSNSTTDKAIVHYIDYDSYPISNKDLEITPGNYNITTNTSATQGTNIFIDYESDGTTVREHGFNVGDIVRFSNFTDSGSATGESLLNGRIAIVADSSQFSDESFQCVGLSITVSTSGGIVEKDIADFPSAYERLVILYAAIQSIGLYLATFRATKFLTGHIDKFPTETPIVPNPPIITIRPEVIKEIGSDGDEMMGYFIRYIQNNDSIDGDLLFPEFIMPQIDTSGDDGNSQIGEIEQSMNWADSRPELDSGLLDLPASDGSLTDGYMGFWTKLQEYTEIEEDEDLAGAQLKNISLYMGAFDTQMKGNVSDWSAKASASKNAWAYINQKLNGHIQRLIKNGEIDLSAELERARQSVSVYTASISKYEKQIINFAQVVEGAVKEFESNLKASVSEYEWYEKTRQELKFQYNQGFASIGPLKTQQAPQGNQRRARR